MGGPLQKNPRLSRPRMNYATVQARPIDLRLEQSCRACFFDGVPS